ncbi:MAG: hypothetical protein LBC18_13830 [Opitutaceae bacterium]|jgi:hypothetical protein|nr:hypothetical protein [Opitutaceae bacterium]
MSTQSLNQFAPGALAGDSVKGPNLNKVSARILPASAAVEFIAGQAVKLASGASPEILVDAAGADDAPFGVILYNTKKNTVAPGAVVEIALAGSFVYLEGGAAVARGSLVKSEPGSGAVSPAAAGEQALGIAVSQTGAAGQLVAVLIAPQAAYTLPPATANTLGGVKVGAGLAVAQDGTLSAT